MSDYVVIAFDKKTLNNVICIKETTLAILVKGGVIKTRGVSGNVSLLTVSGLLRIEVSSAEVGLTSSFTYST